MNDWIMKAILGALVCLVVLVGCQTWQRTVVLPTTSVMKQEEQPARMTLDKPDEPAIDSTGDPVTDTILMFRKACLNQKSFWIQFGGQTEQYVCEKVNGE